MRRSDGATIPANKILVGSRQSFGIPNLAKRTPLTSALGIHPEYCVNSMLMDELELAKYSVDELDQTGDRNACIPDSCCPRANQSSAQHGLQSSCVGTAASTWCALPLQWMPSLRADQIVQYRTAGFDSSLYVYATGVLWPMPCHRKPQSIYMRPHREVIQRP